MLAALHRWVAEHGAPPASNDWKRASETHPNRRSVIDRFGSWEAYLRAGGYHDDADALAVRRDKRLAPSRTPDELIDAIVDWIEEHGRPPSLVDWHPQLAELHGYPDKAQRWHAGAWPHADQVRRAWGSWNNAIRAAEAIAMPSGLKRATRAGRSGRPVEPWSPERICAAIREWTSLHGKPPTSYDWSARLDDGPRWPHARTVFHHWHSWADALRAAGVNPTRERIRR